MYINKKIFLLMCCIFSFIYFFNLSLAKAAEFVDEIDATPTDQATIHSPFHSLRTAEEEDAAIDSRYAYMMGKGDDSLVSLDADRSEDGGDDRSSELELLDKYFEPTIRKVYVGDTTKQILGGVASVLVMLPSVQVPVPLCLGALGEIGLTTSILPSSPELIVGTAVVPLLTGTIASYHGTAKALTYVPQEVVELQKKVTDRPFTRFERIFFSPVSTAFRTIFWGALFSAIIIKLESNVQNWGNPLVWGICFSGLYLLPVFFMYVYETLNPNDHPKRPYENDIQKKSHEKLQGIIKAAEEEIKINGLTDKTRQLAKDMNVLFTAALEGEEGVTDPLLRSKNEEPKEEDSIRQASTSHKISKDQVASQQREKLRLIRVFEDMIDIEKDIPQSTKIWDERKKNTASWASYIAQGASFPISVLITFGLAQKGFSLFVPSEWVLTTSILTTVAAFAGQAFFASLYKEHKITKDDYSQALTGYRPDSPPYFGARIPQFIAVGGSVAFGVLVAENYLRHDILKDQIGITNVTAQALLVSPLLVGTIYAGTRKFIGKQLGRFSLWIATGMLINFYWKGKLLRCVDQKNTLADGSILLQKIQEIKEKQNEMNPIYSYRLCKELGLIEEEKEPGV